MFYLTIIGAIVLALVLVRVLAHVVGLTADAADLPVDDEPIKGDLP